MRLLIHPGWQNSGPAHWQSRWQDPLGATRVIQQDWMEPQRAEWVRGLHNALQASPEPAVLLCHSLGCVTLAHYVAIYAATQPEVIHRIRAAWLVAPADVERHSTPVALANFAPIPLIALPFRSRVIASDNDPYCSLARAQYVAQHWGSEWEVLSNAGHINPEAGFGDWPAGLAALRAWLTTLPSL